MQRDMDLIREILIKTEKEYNAGDKEIDICKISPDGYEEATVIEHLILMYEAKLFQKLEVQDCVNRIRITGVGNLSNKGYDMLDKIKDDTVWKKTKEVVKEKALPPVLDVFTNVASAILSSMIEGAIKGLKN